MTSGTMFHKTQTPLSVWFETVWLMTADKGGVSAEHLQRILPIASYQTAWAMLARLRHVMSASESEPLHGRVEVDETFIGGTKPGRVGRGALGKTLVAGAIEITGTGWGRARMAVISDASAPVLRGFITANITPGSIVVSDGWASYPAALTGYEHDRLNVAASGRPAHESLPGIHRLFALAKRTIDGTYHGSVATGHMDEYLNEFVFRFKRRHSRHRGLIFMRLLQRAVAGDPITYRDLVRNSRPKTITPTGRTGPRNTPSTLNTGPAEHPWRQTH